MSRQRGYTLVELLIVLAILVLISTLSWPALRNAAEKSRLKTAAKRLQGELNKARARAIKSASPVLFSYRAGSSEYSIATQPQAWRQVGLPQDGFSSDSESMGTPRTGSAEEDATGIRLKSSSLDDSIVFEKFASSSAVELPAEFVAGPTETEFDSGQPAAGMASDEWSKPIVFRPDGRATNHDVTLRSQGGYSLTVSIRGITGITSVSQVERDSPASSRVDAPQDGDTP